MHAPTLFSIMFSAMLMGTFRDPDTGIPFRFRTHRKLFNPRQLKAIAKMTEMAIRILFSDDCALNACQGKDMQSQVQFLFSLGQLWSDHQH